MDRDAAADADDKAVGPLVPGSRVRPDPNVLAKRVDDEIVLVHLETNRIYELNRTASFLWDALAAGATQAELEQRLALEFDVEREQLAREIDELLRQSHVGAADSHGVMGRPTAGPAGTWLATLRKGGTERFEVSAGPGSSHSVASDGDVTVLFDGLLHSRREWLNDFSLPTASDASLVLNAYLRWGEGVLERVKGLFALIVWDGGKDLLLCARDPHGMHPCFYADDAGDLFLSASAQALARHPRIPGTVDRVAIADHLCHRWPKLESTYFDAVRRLPGGYALRVREGRRTVARYWDPIPPGRPIDYITEEEAGRFPELLDQAVDRCLPGGPAAIYLSGGLDSVSIAALAQEQLRDRDVGPLLALSLVFEHPDANEEGTQRAVATRLGLPQKIVTVGDAVGPNGLLADALEMSASRSAPMMNLWNPAYAFLARYAAEHGCEVILTGNGGDEWLEAGVHNARLALQRLDFATVYRLWASMQRSYPYARGTVARNLLWTYGLRPILGDGARSILERTAPGVLARREQSRFAQTTPAWIAPDPRTPGADARAVSGAQASSSTRRPRQSDGRVRARGVPREWTAPGDSTPPPVLGCRPHRLPRPCPATAPDARRLFERARAAIVGAEVPAARLRAAPEGHGERLLPLCPDPRGGRRLEENGWSTGPGRARHRRRPRHWIAT